MWHLVLVAVVVQDSLHTSALAEAFKTLRMPSTWRVDAAWLNDVILNDMMGTLRMKMTALNANGWNGATYEIWNASNVGEAVSWQLTMRDSSYNGWGGNEWYLKDESNVILLNGTMNTGLSEQFVTYATTVGTVLKLSVRWVERWVALGGCHWSTCRCWECRAWAIWEGLLWEVHRLGCRNYQQLISVWRDL
eukprot:s2709_g5.t1